MCGFNGFNTPFSTWLRHGLYPFSKKVLSKEYYNSSHILNINNITDLVDQHYKKYTNSYLIWNLLSIQIFLKKFNF